jgi:glycosyltransferase involved in cell wall biosynthesis
MPPKLKILILGRDPHLFPTPGGAPNDTFERHALYVEELLRRRPGSEVRIITHTRRPSGQRYAEPRAGMKVYGTFSAGRLQCAFDMARLIRTFRREGWIPDVVSCQTGYEEGMLALLFSSSESRIQIQVHSDYYGENFSRGSVLRSLQKLLIRHVIRRCDQARVVSQGVAQALIESGDIEANRVSLAPVPIIFDAEVPRPDLQNPVVLFVGRLVAEKDLGLWCDAAELIHREVPAARFWIIGDGPERTMLEQRLGAFGGRMELLGAQRYSDLAAIYAKSSVFLLSSRYEGLGRVIVEAMLARVSIVAPDMVGPRDLITDGETGRLVARDANSLARAVVGLLENTARAQQLATKAKLWAEQNYSFQAVSCKLVQSWEDAASMPRRAK